MASRDIDFNILVSILIVAAVVLSWLIGGSVIGEVVDKKPEGMELVLTGRNATEVVIKRADLVSCIGKIKHPYDNSISQRRGIEY